MTTPAALYIYDFNFTFTRPNENDETVYEVGYKVEATSWVAAEQLLREEFAHLTILTVRGFESTEPRVEAPAVRAAHYDEQGNLTGYEEHLRDSQFLGDARRCPRHPNVKTSSDDGLFDGLCGECEYEMDTQGEYDLRGRN